MADADCITDLKARLKAARDAYHSLMLGGSPRAITDSDGSKVEFTASNVSNLRLYIRQLELELAACSGQPLGLGSIGALF